jgi:DNA repair protein RadD
LEEAREIIGLWSDLQNEGFDLSIDYVGSCKSKLENADIVDALKQEELDVIVHVGMLGEGFDHPQLTVCCIFRRFGSYAPFAQFIGRVIRKIESRDALPEDNYAYIVAHPGLGLQEHWEAFVCENKGVDPKSLMRQSKPAIMRFSDVSSHVLSEDSQEFWFAKE